jgi:hypothetical protein
MRVLQRRIAEFLVVVGDREERLELLAQALTPPEATPAADAAPPDSGEAAPALRGDTADAASAPDMHARRTSATALDPTAWPLALHRCATAAALAADADAGGGAGARASEALRAGDIADGGGNACSASPQAAQEDQLHTTALQLLQVRPAGAPHRCRCCWSAALRSAERP